MLAPMSYNVFTCSWRTQSVMAPTLRKQLSRDCRRAVQYLFGPRRMVMPVLDYERYWDLQQADITTSPTERDLIFARLVGDAGSVLDIGCGTGRLLSFLQATKPRLDTFGLDVSHRAIEIARQRGCNCEVADATVSDFRLTRKYDYIVLSEVLEHLPNPEQLLINVKGSFTKGLLISIPNIGYYPHRLRLLAGSFPIHSQWHPAEHLRYWTVRDFREWTSNLGFTLEHVEASNGFPVLYRAWPNLFGHMVVFLVAPSTRDARENHR